jgi:hypothetical protein
MSQVLRITEGKCTERPYRVIKDHFGIGVEMLCNDNAWDDVGMVFETLADALAFIAKHDLDADLERNERKLGL